MRVVLRRQEDERGEGDFYLKSRRRKLGLFKEADEATGGSICKRIDDIVKEEASFVTSLLEDALHENIEPPTGRGPIEIKQVRTEVERLLDYLDFRHLCKGDSLV